MKVAIASGWLERLRSALAQTPSLQELSDGRLVRYAAQQAAQNQLEPAFVDTPTDLTVNVSILSTDTWFTEYKHHHRVIDQSQLLVAMANAYLEDSSLFPASQTQSKLTGNSKLLSLRGLDVRPQQLELATFLTHSTARKTFRICEASTGIGKGLATVVAAIESKLANPQRQVIVAAPTLALVDQLYNDYLVVAQEHDIDLKARKSQSSAEFLSRRLCQFWCEEFNDHPDRKAFEQALDATDTYSIDAFQEFHDIPLHQLTVMHDTSTSDPGYHEFIADKEQLRDSDLIFCTHSLLGLSVLHGRRLTREHGVNWKDYEAFRDAHFGATQTYIPFYQYDNHTRIDSDPEAAAGFFAPSPIYLIDEAHLLTDMIGLVCSSSVSLESIRRALQQYRGKHADSVLLAMDGFRQSVPAETEGSLPLRNSSATRTLQSFERAILTMLEQFIKAKGKRRLERTIAGRSIMKSASTLRRFASESHAVTLKASPVRQYLTIEGSANSDAMVMDFLVHSAAGMSFTSASIHLLSKSDALNGYSYIAAQLELPAEQVVTHPPLTSSWLSENVDLFMAPNSPEFNPKSVEFLEHCGATLEHLCSNATGGTMVLCTSYEQIQFLANYLDSPRVLMQKQGQSMSQLKERYLADYQAGNRPVWLATGAAWTGIDVTDHGVAAKDDMAIENLVIIKLPFEVVISGQKSNFFAQLARCYFRLKQGLGRLVRRPGRENMRIYMLDGRVNVGNDNLKILHNYLTTTYTCYTLSSSNAYKTERA